MRARLSRNPRSPWSGWALSGAGVSSSEDKGAPREEGGASGQGDENLAYSPVQRSATVPFPMRITRQIRYAIYGVFDLAYNGENWPTRVHEIGERQNVPTRYLEQIFQRLRRAGLVDSKRGPGGGYALARPPGDISLADILVALEGSVLAPSDAGSETDVQPAFVWELLEARVSEVLRGISVADLCRDAAQRGVQRAETQPAMYHI